MLLNIQIPNNKTRPTLELLKRVTTLRVTTKDVIKCAALYYLAIQKFNGNGNVKVYKVKGFQELMTSSYNLIFLYGPEAVNAE